MRKWTEHIIELAVIGVIAGATGAVVVVGLRGVADAGDLLGFVGAAVGAFLTIGGALWVEGYKRRIQTNERRMQTLGILEGFQADLDTVQNARKLIEEARAEGHSGTRIGNDDLVVRKRRAGLFRSAMHRHQ